MKMISIPSPLSAAEIEIYRALPFTRLITGHIGPLDVAYAAVAYINSLAHAVYRQILLRKSDTDASVYLLHAS